MTVAVYAGSFDPFTLGHLDIGLKAAQCFSEVIIAPGGNSKKETLFTLPERCELIEGALQEAEETHAFFREGRIQVVPFIGLLVDFCFSVGASVIVRGLRAVSDFDQEMAIAHANRSMTSDINTIFFPTEPEHSFISSSITKELARHESAMAQSSLGRYVTWNVREALQTKFGYFHG